MSLYRYDPPLGSSTMDRVVRSSAEGPVVCGTCGCRLQPPTAWLDGDASATSTYRHFEGLPGRDARGCRVACVDLDHGLDGRVVA
jgi:hypothetical protein